MKNRVAKVFVVILLLTYPLAHWIVHVKNHTDPWTMGAWAMYAVPRGKIAVSVVKDGLSQSAHALCPQETVNYVSRSLALGRGVDGSELWRCLRQKNEGPFDVRVLRRMFDGPSGKFVIVEHKLRGSEPRP